MKIRVGVAALYLVTLACVVAGPQVEVEGELGAAAPLQLPPPATPERTNLPDPYAAGVALVKKADSMIGGTKLDIRRFPDDPLEVGASAFVGTMAGPALAEALVQRFENVDRPDVDDANYGQEMADIQTTSNPINIRKGTYQYFSDVADAIGKVFDKLIDELKGLADPNSDPDPSFGNNSN